MGVGRRAEEDFEAFVRARGPALLKTAALLTGGDHGHAEDLLQVVLARASRRWSRLEQPEAYVRQALARAAIDRWRRPDRSVLVPPPETAQPGAQGQVDDSLTLLPALATLPSRQRVALVLRYLCDLSVEDAAREMRISEGSVKTHCSRGLAALRTSLAPALLEDT